MFLYCQSLECISNVLQRMVICFEYYYQGFDNAYQSNEMCSNTLCGTATKAIEHEHSMKRDWVVWSCCVLMTSNHHWARRYQICKIDNNLCLIWNGLRPWMWGRGTPCEEDELSGREDKKNGFVHLMHLGKHHVKRTNDTQRACWFLVGNEPLS